MEFLMNLMAVLTAVLLVVVGVYAIAAILWDDLT
jgi:hypothetical protein